MKTQFGKYLLLEPLAAGGMGEVFLAKAGSHGVERSFAIKRILTRHQDSAEFARQLRREAEISIELVHPNIAQVFEFGECDGHFFLAMEYVQGLSLASLLTLAVELGPSRLSAADALFIGVQLCRGLDYAHERRAPDGAVLNIVHRDVSPQNILVDTSGMVKLIDFGIAKAADSATLTETGLIKGKVTYMSPEQSRGEPLDRRDDIFAIGVVLFECLAQQRLHGDANTMKVLGDLHAGKIPDTRSRLPKELPEPVLETLEGALNPNRNERIATASELEQKLALALHQLAPGHTAHDLGRMVTELREIEKARRDKAGRTQPQTADIASTASSSATIDVISRDDAVSGTAATIAQPPKRRRAVVAAAALAIGLSVALGVSIYKNVTGAPTAEATLQPVSVLIANFDNQTGDPLFDGSLEQGLNIGLEGATFITAFKRASATKLLQTIKPDTALDEAGARLIAIREGIKLVVAGAIHPRGSGYEISARMVNPEDGSVIARAAVEAKNKFEILSAVGSLTDNIREELGDESVSADNRAPGETFTAASLEAVKSYTQAQELAAAARYDDSLPLYEAAVKEDPNFGRAYSGWALSLYSLGREDEAAALWKQAMSKMDTMSERERYRTLGLYYVAIAGDFQKAIESYTTLVEKYPADNTGQNNLAISYYFTLDFQKALETASKALAIYPSNKTVKTNYALFAMLAGDHRKAVELSEELLAVDNGLWKAWLPIAMARLDAGNRDGARQAYEKMTAVDGRGAAFANLGLADIAVFEGDYAKASELLTAGIALDVKDGNKRLVANKYMALAEARKGLGDAAGTRDALRKGLAAHAGLGQRVPAALFSLELGDETFAEDIAEKLSADLQPKSRSFGLVIKGALATQKGRHAEAMDALRAGIPLTDSWLLRYYLGRAYFAAGRYVEARDEFETCVKRRGEATALFQDDDEPTWRYVAALEAWLAKTRETLAAQPSAN